LLPKKVILAVKKKATGTVNTIAERKLINSTRIGIATETKPRPRTPWAYAAARTINAERINCPIEFSRKKRESTRSTSRLRN
jgi:hypothetical protein